MTARSRTQPDAMEPPSIHEASLASGPSGSVLRGAELTREIAIARRLTGQDVVICGNDFKANRRLALDIESSVGTCERHEPHDALAGPASLPHFQQKVQPPSGHCFYETSRRKAR